MLTNYVAKEEKTWSPKYCWNYVFFSPKKHYFALVSKQLHHRPPKIQQPSLYVMLYCYIKGHILKNAFRAMISCSR